MLPSQNLGNKSQENFRFYYNIFYFSPLFPQCVVVFCCLQTAYLSFILLDSLSTEDNPCTSLKCSPNRECSIDHMGVARCVCPMPCQRMMELVCGSDGVTYENPCQLKRQNCLNGTLVALAYTGACGMH